MSRRGLHNMALSGSVRPRRIRGTLICKKTTLQIESDAYLLQAVSKLFLPSENLAISQYIAGNNIRSPFIRRGFADTF